MSSTSGKANGVWTDLIDEFMAFTTDSTSPEIYRLWSAISMVSGALERRVWTQTGNRATFANFYILLVGSPGVGKSIIKQVAALWRETKETSGNNEAFSISSNSTTKAALVDQLVKAQKVRLPSYFYHALLVPAEEFEVLLPSYNPEFVSFFNDLWNNDSVWEESRRHGPAKDVSIPNPFLHLLGGVQPAWFTAHFPEEAWSTGLIRRTIMVYAESQTKMDDPFKVTPNYNDIREHILQRLGHLSQLQGAVPWHEDAANIMRDWYRQDCPPTPTHSKLAIGYNTTRFEFAIKLAITSSVSRTGNIVEGISKADVTRAVAWLLEAESRMPDIFMSMAGKNDGAVLEELHVFVLSLWNRNGKEGISDALVNKFLSVRVPSEKIGKIIGTAERIGMIVKSPGSDRWLPRPKDPLQLH